VIGFARPPEPAALAILRAGKLAAARRAMASGAKVDFTEYEIVKDALAAMQLRKCCYCEKREEQSKYRDVDHYRPKAVYWWLAWTWENLLFACIDCNRDQKRDRFPLSPGDTRLVAEQAPPGAERPLVLDPSDPSMVPAREIEFRRERIPGRERWVPRGVTARGRETIAVCGLDRPNLLDLYTEHVIHAVRPKLAGFLAACEEGNTQTTFQAWERAKRGLLARERPFRALSHDALNALVPVELRARHRLLLDRPGP
jgi:HNH endonuclease